MNVTTIEWTTFTANPLKYADPMGVTSWACVRHSDGCRNCYAETLAKRYGRGGPFNVQTTNLMTPFLDNAEMHKMRTAKRIGGIDVSGSMCFVGDMTDMFGEWVEDELLDVLFTDVLELRRDVTWQILTKRADRMRAYLDWRYGEGRLPPRHIWFGVSVENRDAMWRLDELAITRAAVKFCSFEPLLGRIDPFEPRCLKCRRPMPLGTGGVCTPERDGHQIVEIGDWLDLAIIGGESGAGARECYVPFVRDLVTGLEEAALVQTHRTARFVKQLGSFVVDRNDAGFEGDTPESWPMDTRIDENIHGFREEYQGAPVRVRLRDRKGGDMSEWPQDLRVREFPQ